MRQSSLPIPARILLVEDYPTNQLVAKQHLLAEGFQVDLAENGFRAVELFRQKKYDLVFMDIQMPVMDGFEATRMIRDMETGKGAGDDSPESRTGRRTPIIAMTAHALKGYGEKCRAAGMDGIITKPLKKKKLIRETGRWLGKGLAPVRLPACQTGLRAGKSRIGHTRE